MLDLSVLPVVIESLRYIPDQPQPPIGLPYQEQARIAADLPAFKVGFNNPTF